MLVLTDRWYCIRMSLSLCSLSLKNEVKLHFCHHMREITLTFIKQTLKFIYYYYHFEAHAIYQPLGKLQVKPLSLRSLIKPLQVATDKLFKAGCPFWWPTNIINTQRAHTDYCCLIRLLFQSSLVRAGPHRSLCTKLLELLIEVTSFTGMTSFLMPNQQCQKQWM